MSKHLKNIGLDLCRERRSLLTARRDKTAATEHRTPITVLGWNLDQWLCVCKWAGSDANAVIEIFRSFPSGDFGLAISLRKKWMLAGGPACGPSAVILSEQTHLPTGTRL